MKIRQLAAVTFAMAAAFAMPALAANDADAVAVYQEMEAKSEAMDATHAYMDYNVQMTSADVTMQMRMEEDMKAVNLLTPEQMRMSTYMRMSITGMEVSGETAPGLADGSAVSAVTSTYYENGMYYIDSEGTRTRMEMPLDTMMASMKETLSGAGGSLEYMDNLKVRTEGENRILSYTMDASKMNVLLDQMMGMGTVSSLAEGTGVSYRDISGEAVVAPDGTCLRQNMNMTMDMTADGESMTMVLTGSVSYVDQDQAIEIPVPDLSGYTLAE